MLPSRVSFPAAKNRAARRGYSHDVLQTDQRQPPQRPPLYRPPLPLGKAIVSQDPASHGLYSATPVIQGLESPAAWEQHRDSTTANCAPVGQVEAGLAERVALI